MLFLEITAGSFLALQLSKAVDFGLGYFAVRSAKKRGAAMLERFAENVGLPLADDKDEG